MEIERGEAVAVRTAFGTQLERVATTGVEKGHDFPVVWVATREDWDAAVAEGREPDALPWPAEDVLPVEQGVTASR